MRSRETREREGHRVRVWKREVTERTMRIPVEGNYGLETEAGFRIRSGVGRLEYGEGYS